MKISIWDLDYFKTQKGVNCDCMKISSFHKQRGDIINFITTEDDINRPYDYIYITKKSDKIKNPPLKFFDKRSRIWGEGFRYLSNWKIPDVILACRPDYLLYPNLETQFERADMIQFFNDSGKLLPLTQDAENTFKNKKTLIVDRAFWKASQKDILYALNKLKGVWNIAFLEPISLKKIVCDKLIRENFLQLEFTRNTQFKFFNDIGDLYDDALKITEFLDELRERAPKTALGIVNFSPTSLDHYASPDNAWFDLERCLKIIELGKVNGFEYHIQKLSRRTITPYFNLFEVLNRWTEKSYKYSLIEFIALPTAKKNKCTVADVYANSLLWNDARMCDMMATLYRRKEWISAYALRRWKENTFEITKIDWTYIQERLWI